MAGEQEDGAGGGHFDMAEVRKAEKERSRKGKKKHRKEKNGKRVDEGESGPGFEMDVKDPRFASVYENHEFAIDPSNPRFSGTEAMRKVLEEGRRKRKRGDDEEGGS